MDMDTIMEMLKNNRTLWVAATVAGGFSFLVSIINAIFLYFQNKKQHDFDKQLEKYKAGIDNKTYMCKTKFDAEFSMYRELSQAFAVLVKECSQMFPTLTKDSRNDYEKYKPIHDKCVDVIVSAQDKLNACAPFISEIIYIGYSELEELCKTQLSDFQDFRLRPDAKDYVIECKDAYKEVYKRTRDIQSKYQNISTTLRSYIDSIDIIN